MRQFILAAIIGWIAISTSSSVTSALADEPSGVNSDRVNSDRANSDRVDPDALQVDRIMYKDPTLVPPPLEVIIPPGMKPLWVRALQRPEAELQRLAADTLALAHDRGLRNAEDVHGLLVERLRAAAAPSDVRRAAAHALVVMDVREQAPLLAEQAEQGGLAMAQVIEPALAAWDFQPIRAVWRERLQQPNVQPELLALAIDGVAQVGDAAALDDLLVMTLDPRRPASVRLAAARSAATLADANLTDEAVQLAGGDEEVNLLARILAVELLRNHSDAGAIELLGKLAVDPETAVAAKALDRLFAIDPQLVRPLATDAATSRDVNVRRVAARSLVEQASPESVALLGSLLDDVNPGLRRWVAASLVALAGQEELHDTVIAQAEQMLATDRWRGIEQAAVVLVNLDHKPAGTRLVELLVHPRAEAAIAAAWGLRRLAIPEHLPAMLAHAETIHEELFKPENSITAGQVLQLAQLFQAFGTMRYMPAESMMRAYIPKNYAIGEQTRAAAIWALGYLHADQSPDDLARALAQRLSDVASSPPEMYEVRRMSAISLGRMKAASALQTLRNFQRGEGPGYVGLASGWAVARITGEPQPELPPTRIPLRDWFLTPAE